MEPPCHRYECDVAFADTDASGWGDLAVISVAEKNLLEASA